MTVTTESIRYAKISGHFYTMPHFSHGPKLFNAVSQYHTMLFRVMSTTLAYIFNTFIHTISHMDVRNLQLTNHSAHIQWSTICSADLSDLLFTTKLLKLF